MEITTKLKERFCKDNNLPIKLYKEPYFTSRLELFEQQLQSKTLYKIFENSIKDYNNEQDYFSYYNKIKDDMMNYIKSTEGYNKFITEDFTKYSNNNRNITEKDVFKTHNIDKNLLSIDMIKANFNALRHYDKNIFEGAETYEEFVRRFTDNEHIVRSKYIRQVVFGNCNPKRQTTYEKHLMGKVLDNVLEIVDKNAVINYGNDELVIDITELDTQQRKELYTNIQTKNDIPLRVEEYVLKKIDDTDVYVKTFTDGTYEFKCVNNLIYPFIIRAYNNEEVQEEDKVFYHEGMLAKFIDVPEIEKVV